MSDKVYVYGEHNGSSYREVSESADGRQGSTETRTHWDPRLQIDAIAGTVQVGVVPPSAKSTDEQGLWDTDDGQFLSLSRDGINRTIRALREARDRVYGKDE